MTGSGACVFAAFASEDAAQQALSRMPRVAESTGENAGGNAGKTAGFVARALNRHPLWRWPHVDVVARNGFPWGVAKW